MKVGFAKVRMDGVWKKWEEVEKETGERVLREGWERTKEKVKEGEGAVSGEVREEKREVGHRISSKPRKGGGNNS